MKKLTKLHKVAAFVVIVVAAGTGLKTIFGWDFPPWATASEFHEAERSNGEGHAQLLMLTAENRTATIENRIAFLQQQVFAAEREIRRYQKENDSVPPALLREINNLQGQISKLKTRLK